MSGPVLFVSSDLLFRSKVDEVARRLGLALRVAKSREQLERHLAGGPPAMAIVDLETDSIDPAAAITRIREVGGAELPIIGYTGHTNTDAIQTGRNAGAMVVARGALSAQLPAVLGRLAADGEGESTAE